jgi:hypothetical protein
MQFCQVRVWTPEAMTRYRLIPAAVVAALALSGGAVAGQIYKWVDENGNVHYEDRPTNSAQVARMDIRSRPTDSDAVQARVDAQREANAVREQVRSEAPPEMSKAELRAEQEERARKCQMYRDRLEAFERSTRLYKEDESGERQYLDDEQVQAARARVEEQIEEYCGS